MNIMNPEINWAILRKILDVEKEKQREPIAIIRR